MSTETRAISPSRFAEAIQDLPIENIYSKAHEIDNSISHLKRSNAQLQEYSDSMKNDMNIPEETRRDGDKDCLEAIRENMVVIDRQRDRVDLLRREVERRGGRWHGADTGKEGTNGEVDGGVAEDNLDGDETANAPRAAVTSNGVNSRTGVGGRLSDEELRRQLEARMMEDNDEGMHL